MTALHRSALRAARRAGGAAFGPAAAFRAALADAAEAMETCARSTGCESCRRSAPGYRHPAAETCDDCGAVVAEAGALTSTGRMAEADAAILCPPCYRAQC